MLSRFFQTLTRYAEATLFSLFALGALAAAIFLVSQDLLHAPAHANAGPVSAAIASQPQVPLAPAAAPMTPSGGTSVAKVEAAAQARPDTRTDLTLFQRTDFDADGKKLHIVVGLVYSDVKATEPQREFCYLDAGQISAAAAVTIALAEKDGKGQVAQANLQESDAKTVGIALLKLQEAQGRCAFL